MHSNNKLMFFIILLAGCLTSFASDVYTPAVPAIAASLHAPINWVQWSMAIYMLGAAVSQLFYGPLSEGIGRKTPLLIGLSVLLAGSVMCLLAPNIQLLLIGRLVQGCGAGACAVLWRSIFRDLFTGELLAKYASYLVVFVMFIIPAAPALGGYLQQYFGWRAIFIFMCVYILLALFCVYYRLPETSRHHHPERLRLNYIIATFRRLLTNRIFMGITACSFLTYGAFFAWFTAAPVLLIHHIGLSPVAFGWITFLGGGSAYALAGWLNGRLVTRFGMPNMLRFGFFIMLISGIIMWLGEVFWGLNALAIIVPAIVFYFGSTFIWPNAFSTAFTPFGDIAGYVGALYGCLQISGAAVVGSIISYLPTINQIPLAMAILIASCLAWLIYEFAVTARPDRSPN